VTSIGIANFVARFLVIFAPLVAEVPYPMPLVLVTMMLVVAAVSALFLVNPATADADEVDNEEE